jgi:hypothetical protein
MIGEDKREDITCLYKHAEGSAEERAAFQNAHSFGQGSGLRKALLNKDEDGNDFEIGIYCVALDFIALQFNSCSCIAFYFIIISY